MAFHPAFWALSGAAIALLLEHLRVWWLARRLVRDLNLQGDPAPETLAGRPLRVTQQRPSSAPSLPLIQRLAKEQVMWTVPGYLGGIDDQLRVRGMEMVGMELLLGDMWASPLLRVNARIQGTQMVMTIDAEPWRHPLYGENAPAIGLGDLRELLMERVCEIPWPPASPAGEAEAAPSGEAE